MTPFILACGALVLLSGVFFLFPPRRSAETEEDLAKANLQWYRRRQQELADSGEQTLQEDASLRLLEDEEQRFGSPVAPASHRFPVWILMPLVVVLSGGLYFYLGAAPDVLITRQLQAISAQASSPEVAQLIRVVEARAAQRPDNLHYAALLGRYYMGQEDYSRAAMTYDQLVTAVPEDAQALAFAAQAEYLAADRTLSPRARLRAEQALAADPYQRTALGLLGMASFEQGQYRAAIEYWQRLVAMEAPASESAQMIESVIATAQEKLGVGPAVPISVAQPDALAGAGVTVQVAAPQGTQISPSDTVFVLARNAQSSSRMPIAVQRLSGSQLPLTLRLDDSNSMAGQKLSDVASVIVAVQVSPAGRPGEANATWMGEVGPLTPSLEGSAVAVELRPGPLQTGVQ